MGDILTSIQIIRVLSYTTHFLVTFDIFWSYDNTHLANCQRAEKCDTQQNMIFIQNLILTVTVMLMFWSAFICILQFLLFWFLALMSTVFHVANIYREQMTASSLAHLLAAVHRGSRF